MSYLLDAHTLIWAITEPGKLSRKAVEIIENPNNEVFVSAITFWEISLKYSLGKLDLQGIGPENMAQFAIETGFTHLPLLPAEAAQYHKIAATWHRDPFDRMLIWQAINRNLTLISKDKTVAQYKSVGLNVIW